MQWKKYYLSLLKLLFPPTCFWCWKEWSYCCIDCHKTIQAHPDICYVCGKFSQFWKTCLHCFKESSLDWVMIWFLYQWVIKKIIQSIKYKWVTDPIHFLSSKLWLLFQSTPYHKQENIVVTSVPSHRRKKHMIRWYNQSEILAKSFAKQQWLPYVELFIKKKRTRSQTRYSRNKRFSNIENSFALLQWITLSQKQNVLIVDDVITTGATLNSLADCIKEKYPKSRIYWVVIARHN